MAEFIDEEKWADALTRSDWYLLMEDDFRQLEQRAREEPDQAIHKQMKEEAYGMVEQALAAGTIPLAEAGEDLDRERQLIDTVVIHHTANPPGMSLARLNAMQLLRVYGLYYANPTDQREKHFRGQPVWSNHFYKGRQVFWVYHWLVREDGTAEHILDDRYIGWHAGDWKVNTRSVAICIDDILTDKAPSDAALNGLADIIRNHYPDVALERILGHRDVLPDTICPGQPFTDIWKEQLIVSLK
jgi:N-acetylmuramoyl-L-alanine amidase